MDFSVCGNHADNIGCFGQTAYIEAVVVAVVCNLSALHSEEGDFGHISGINAHHHHLVTGRIGCKIRLAGLRNIYVESKTSVGLDSCYLNMSRGKSCHTLPVQKIISINAQFGMT